MVQWLRLHVTNSEGTGLIPDRETGELRFLMLCGMGPQKMLEETEWKIGLQSYVCSRIIESEKIEYE